MNRVRTFAIILTLIPFAGYSADDAVSGLAVPVTISAGALYTHRLQGEDPASSPLAGGFRAMLYPTLKLGGHFFGYAAVQLRSTPYFYYDSYEADHAFKADVIQAFAGYTTTARGVTFIAKVGRLSSAFGAFPLRYDDTENPLLDQPSGYNTAVHLRPDQLPCGVRDLIHQNTYYGGGVDHYCGGSTVEGYGMVPVTLYGLPGIQLDLSASHTDLRLQLTNSSPANPHGLLSDSQHLQWTAGGGYTIARQLRVGASAFEGPYMDQPVVSLLPAGKTVRDFPATGVGIDAQWSGGRWSLSGEWQRFRFESPNFTEPPTVSAAYLEIKAIVTPRLYLAGRFGRETYGAVEDVSGSHAAAFSPAQHSYEFGAGYRLNRSQLVKASYEWLQTDGSHGMHNNVLGIQVVTTIRSLSKAFR